MLGPCRIGRQSVDVRTLPGAGSPEAVDSVAFGTFVAGPRGTGTVYFSLPLRASDVVQLSSDRRVGGFDVRSSTERRAGHCDGPVVPPRPP
jgi:hypothetical protein